MIARRVRVFSIGLSLREKVCLSRDTHGWGRASLEAMLRKYEPTPEHMILMDVKVGYCLHRSCVCSVVRCYFDHFFRSFVFRRFWWFIIIIIVIIVNTIVCLLIFLLVFNSYICKGFFVRLCVCVCASASRNLLRLCGIQKVM